jgi:hypothetical protein
MATLTFPFGAAGVDLDVLIGLDGKTTTALHVSGQPIPPPIRVRGLMDTACDLTAVAPWILRQLGSPYYAKASTHTAGGSVQVDVYEASLSISGPAGAAGPMLVFPTLVVTELAHAPRGIDVLVGMDVMLTCLTLIDGPGRQFTLTF